MPNSIGEQVPGVLLQATRALRRFLDEVLPTLSSSWWAELVFANLSFHQRRAVETRRISALSGLDLAALLRVLDANWHAIADKLLLTSEARYYLKEMRTVRDRWAHAAAADFSNDDVYRDLDTLQRFLVSINADEELLSEVTSVEGYSAPGLFPRRCVEAHGILACHNDAQ
jgi:hypothetical protein